MTILIGGRKTIVNGENFYLWLQNSWHITPIPIDHANNRRCWTRNTKHPVNINNEELREFLLIIENNRQLIHKPFRLRFVNGVGR